MIQLSKLDWPREPFRGIEQFRFIDRPIFFERRDEIRRLIRLVSIYRGTLLYGESGVGKSSVINAGFIPAMLEEGFLPERLRVQPVPGAELVVERLALSDEGTFIPILVQLEIDAPDIEGVCLERYFLSRDEEEDEQEEEEFDDDEFNDPVDVEPPPSSIGRS